MNIVLVSIDPFRVSVARLPKALRAAGFTVIACCPSDALVARTAFLDGLVRIKPPVRDGAIWFALREIRSRRGRAFIVPGDERTIFLLRRLAQNPPERPDDIDLAVLEDLNASLGVPQLREAAASRAALCRLTDGGACRFPAQVPLDPSCNLFEAAQAVGFPLMVKSDGSAGGSGVFAIGSPDELDAFVDRSDAFIRHGAHDARLREGEAGVVQRRIAGVNASVALAALNGETLAAFAYGHADGQPSGLGPMTVIRRLDRPDLIDTARSLVAMLGFSGFGGIDAIVEDSTDLPYAVEFNARPTLATHNGAAMGCDLALALRSALTGSPPPPPCPPSAETIAVFPHEWRRDPKSRHLYEARHDVPWDDPDLLAALLQVTP